MSMREIIEAVERGNGCLSSYLPAEHEALWAKFYKAFDGSLDAAFALHEALLPGWRVHKMGEDDNTGSGWWAFLCTRYAPLLESKAYDQPNPARAWLLAILRAVEAGTTK